MRCLAYALTALWLALAPAWALSPANVATITPAYQAPGWTGWTPTSLGSALKGWWAADDHGTANMTDDGAGLISAWVDRASAISATGATTARPTWSATAFTGGLAGVTFDGVANALISTAITALPNGSTAGEIWAEVDQRATPSATIQYPIRYGGGTASTSRGVSRAIAGTSRASILGSASLTDVTVNFFGPHVVQGRWDDLLISGRIDGRVFPTPSTAVVSLATGTTRLRLGAADGGAASGFFQGALRNIIITTALPLPSQQQIEAWMMWDMGRAYALPWNHPYRHRRP